MPTQTPVPVLPPLPTWTDAASVTSYITSLVAGVFAVVMVLTGKSEPDAVQALLPAVGLIVAGGAQIFNVVTHRGVQKAAMTAYATAAAKK